MIFADLTIRCWCDWSAQDDPCVSHDDHIAAYDYPDHEPSPEWNVPEPAPGQLVPEPAPGSPWYCPDRSILGDLVDESARREASR